jgi:hypothetical protein
VSELVPPLSVGDDSLLSAHGDNESSLNSLSVDEAVIYYLSSYNRLPAFVSYLKH